MSKKEFKGGQAKALEANGNVLVSASAGSGKTTILTEKIMQLVAAGHDVRKMAVMTFSNAAADEMKSRIVKGLYELMRDGNNAKIYEQLEAFPFAEIGTIDSFCFRLVKKYFSFVDVDPSVAPLEPDEEVLLLNECADQACEEAILNDNKQERDKFIEFVERYSGTRNIEGVKSLALELRTFIKKQLDADGTLAIDTQKKCEEYYRAYIEKHVKKLNVAVTGMNEAGNRLSPEAADVAKKVTDNAIALVDAKDDLALFFDRLSFCTEIKGGEWEYDKKTADKVAVNAFKTAISAYNSFVKNQGTICAHYRNAKGKRQADEDVETLKSLMRAVERLYADRKKKLNKIDFNDMAQYALTILQTNDGAIAKEVQASYDYIFIDEYQDTNYLQEKIFSLISNGNNVYVVGDVKQSIYRFRFAEPKIFTDRMKDFDVYHTGTNVHMNENFRSHPDVLKFVNAVCEQVMTDDFCGINYVRNDVMVSADPDKFPPDEDAVRVYFYEPDKKQEKPAAKVYSVREGEVEKGRDKETDYLCDMIEREIGQPFCDTDKKEKTKASTISYKHIAVLARTNKRVREIADALIERGIPASVSDGDAGLFRPRELLVDYVRLAVAPDDITVANICADGCHPLTEKEMTEVRRRSPKTSFLEALNTINEETELGEKINKMRVFWQELQRDGRTLRVSELMQKVLAAGLDARVRAMGAEASVRIRRFVSDVSRLECDADPSAFLEYYDDGYEGDRPVMLDDSVSVMTIHKSKGLQFPVVIVSSVHANQVTAHGNTGKLFADGKLGIALTCADFETGTAESNFCTDVIGLKQRNDEREEMARFAYVAFTRAQNRLIVLGQKTAVCTDIDDANSVEDLVTFAANGDPRIKEYYRSDYPEKGEATEPEEVVQKEYDLDELVFSYPYESDTKDVAKTSVSELLARDRDPGTRYAYAEDEPTDESKRGTAYHLVLQNISFDAETEEDVRSCIDDLVSLGEIEEKIANELSAQKILDVLRTEIMQKAQKSEVKREQPFVMPRQKGSDALVQGVIDLLIFEDDGVTVVDYKASKKGAAALREQYRGQMDLYAAAAEGIYKQKVKRKVLVNILLDYQTDL